MSFEINDKKKSSISPNLNKTSVPDWAVNISFFFFKWTKKSSLSLNRTKTNVFGSWFTVSSLFWSFNRIICTEIWNYQLMFKLTKEGWWLYSLRSRRRRGSHRLHVQDGGLGDDHRPVPRVTFQLCFGSLGRHFPRWVKRGFGEGCESVLSHKLTKILKDFFFIFLF